MKIDQISTTQTELVLAIDPGVTSGLALWQHPHLRGVAQLRSTSAKAAAVRIRKAIVRHEPKTVIVEEYVLYPWRSKAQNWSSFHTVRLIGALELICADLKIPLIKQTAQRAKSIKDKELKNWNLYKPGKPHANDAIRHAVAYTLFGKEKGSARSTRRRRNRSSKPRNSRQ